MSFDIERLLRLWTDPLPEDDGAAAESFRTVYTDPVTVNGAPLTALDLVARARTVQAALADPEREVLAVADAGTSVAVVFRLAGRQIGPLDTSVGRLEPTGRPIDLRVMDVLSLTGGRVSSLWMVADWLTTLAAAGAVQMSGRAVPEDPPMAGLRALLTEVAARAADYRAGVRDAAVFPPGEPATVVRAGLGALRDEGADPVAVLAELRAAAEPGLVATTGPRYFGFVVGGSLDAATAADMLAVAWDQPAFNGVTSPAAAVVEEVAGEWLKELLGLPGTASSGFVTGGQGANTVGLAAARHRVLADIGWDVERDGLSGAPAIRVVASAERHATVDRALRLLGLGARAVRPVGCDEQGRIDVAALAAALEDGPPGPAIVCLQAGNVNTGACDDLAAAVDVAHRHGAWAHVDGAFGLWAAASPTTRHLVEGLAAADSWATDGHKWLNVPYDSGYAFCADPEAHRAAMAYTAAYVTGQGQSGLRAPGDYVPESSRRARGFATWAALRQLGRTGVAELVDRCCRLARRFAVELSAVEGIAVVNDVVLNQVLVRFGDDDAATDAVVAAVQRSGECWMGTTTWHGLRLMRVSVSNWSTTEQDVDRAVHSVAGAWQAVQRGPSAALHGESAPQEHRSVSDSR
jgi:glutamate/tyrosine decarboxylase-like PLP-dependent enzyme